MTIIKSNADDPFLPQQALGPYLIQAFIPEAQERAMTAYQVRIAPHQTTAVSYHRVAEELYFVLEGHGTAILNDEPTFLKKGDFLRLPPGTTHGFVTTDAELVMLNIHSPGSRPDRDVYFVGKAPEGFSDDGARR